MHEVKRLLSNLLRLAGTETVQISGMDAAVMLQTLAHAILDLDTRLKALERNTHGDGR